jgi:hypothetical protein
MRTGKNDLFGSDLGYTEPIIKSRCDVRSLTYCDLQCIMIDGLRLVLEMYPEFAETFESDLVHDLTYNLRDGYVDPDECGDYDDDGRGSLLVPAVTVAPTSGTCSGGGSSGDVTADDGAMATASDADRECGPLLQQSTDSVVGAGTGGAVATGVSSSGGAALRPSTVSFAAPPEVATAVRRKSADARIERTGGQRNRSSSVLEISAGRHVTISPTQHFINLFTSIIIVRKVKPTLSRQS